jgi:hypothetical protein
MHPNLVSVIDRRLLERRKPQRIADMQFGAMEEKHPV